MTRTVLVVLLLVMSGCVGNDPPGQTYTLSTTISGLNASGLMLAVNSMAMNVPAGTTSVALRSLLSPGSPYSVTVATQPAGQTCSIAAGSGTIHSANVANVVVTCSAQASTVGGSISGLNGSGLVLASGGDTIAVASGATSFTLPTTVAYGSSYTVTVQTQPAGLACAVSNGTGTMPASAVSNIAISCTDQPFSLGGNINGLGNNAGLVLANGSDTLEVAAGSTSFMMASAVAFGSHYAVVVQAAPLEFTCTPSSASGTMPAGNVNNVVIACAPQSYTVGGTISGLTSSGLVLANGNDTLAVSPGESAFTIPTAVAYGSAYAVTVQSQPVGLTCTVSAGAGTMGSSTVSNVVVTCSANTYTVGGTVGGVSASGLVLLNNGGDATIVNANATQFTMNTGVAYGSGYAITVGSQPTGLVCSVSNGSGTVGAADVMSVSISCGSNTSILYSFMGGSDGADAHGGVIQGSDGNFYGTTLGGDVASDYGTVFKLTAGGTETVLYSFAGGSDGAHPYFGGLIQASDGNFYGTTNQGGDSSVGTIFKVTTSGTETVLYSFTGGSDGGYPYASVIQASDANFYGTTCNGGASGDGTVFKFTASGTETVLYSFAGGSDGACPTAGLIQGNDGNFYGTTLGGGASGNGTVFELTESGNETVLYSFAGGSDGATPYGGVIQGSDGNFYGTTTGGGVSGYGTVFKLTASGTETVLHTFAGGGDGAYPYASVIQANDGNFYGTTGGGDASDYGTVFKITASGTETVLHSFTGGSDSAYPSSGLIQASDGNLYGTAARGGASNVGSVFELRLQ